MNKKILFFCSVTYMGGAETNIIKISKELHALGIEVHIATLEDNGPMFKYCQDGFISSLSVIGLFSKDPIGSVSRFHKLITSNKFDAVLNFGIRVEVFSRIFTKLFSPDTLIITNIRNANSFKKKNEIIAGRATSFLVDRWVSNSVAGKVMYEKREKVPGEKIRVIYNYIEPLASPVQGRPREMNRSNPRIGILANIKKAKGHYDLIPLIKSLQEENIKPVFVCAGVDYTDGDFITHVQQSGLSEYFDIKGYVENKNSFFDDIDIIFLPSYQEGMPTSILEAMLYRKPIISTDVGGIPEQIEHGINGFIHPPGDIEGFKNSIITLINDKELRDTFVSRSLQIIETKFSKPEKIKQWVDVIS